MRTAFCPRLSPIAVVTSPSRASSDCRQPRLRRGLRLGDVGDAAVQLLLAVVQRPHRAVEVGEVPRQRLDRARGRGAPP